MTTSIKASAFPASTFGQCWENERGASTLIPRRRGAHLILNPVNHTQEGTPAVTAICETFTAMYGNCLKYKIWHVGPGRSSFRARRGGVYGRREGTTRSLRADDGESTLQIHGLPSEVFSLLKRVHMLLKKH